MPINNNSRVNPQELMPWLGHQVLTVEEEVSDLNLNLLKDSHPL